MDSTAQPVNTNPSFQLPFKSMLTFPQIHRWVVEGWFSTSTCCTIYSISVSSNNCPISSEIMNRSKGSDGLSTPCYVWSIDQLDWMVEPITAMLLVGDIKHYWPSSGKSISGSCTGLKSIAPKRLCWCLYLTHVASSHPVTSGAMWSIVSAGQWCITIDHQ